MAVLRTRWKPRAPRLHSLSPSRPIRWKDDPPCVIGCQASEAIGHAFLWAVACLLEAVQPAGAQFRATVAMITICLDIETTHADIQRLTGVELIAPSQFQHIGLRTQPVGTSCAERGVIHNRLGRAAESRCRSGREHL